MTSPEDLVKAHQYLYYVEARPVLSDYEYDKFCEAHGIEGGGGSDLASDYSENIKDLAAAILKGSTHPTSCSDPEDDEDADELGLFTSI